MLELSNNQIMLFKFIFYCFHIELSKYPVNFENDSKRDLMT